MDKQRRYEELRDRFNESIDTGQSAISDEEHLERIRLHYEVNGIQPPEFDVPVAISSSDPRDGGLTFYPKKIRPEGWL